MNRLQYDEFLRSISISKNDTYAMLLGAGCSISSGIPSANDCIWDWKGSIYKSNNSSTGNWINNFRNPKVQRIIQTWLDNQGTYIEEGDTSEYSYYAQKCFPIEANRRQYFQKICSNRQPSIGYKILPILVKYGMLDSIWTTNFDDLIHNSCALGGIQAIDISLDSVNRIHQRTQNKSELPIIKLHGDYKYGNLKNTEEELRQQDVSFREKLIEYLNDKHLIVMGYSGRDSSLMDALSSAYSKKGGGMLYWCGYHDNFSKETETLLSIASDNARQAFYIPTDGFDTTLLNIAKILTDDDNELSNELSRLQEIDEPKNQFTPFNLSPDRINKVLKSNCFPLELPDEVFVFDANTLENPWSVINEITNGNFDISAIPYKNKVWAFGTSQSIKSAFQNILSGNISRKPLTEARIYNTGIHHLMLTTVCKLLTKANNLNTDFYHKLWSSDYQTLEGYRVFNAIKLSINKVQNRYYLTLNPSFHIDDYDISSETIQNIGLKFYHKIWNKTYNDYVTGWRNRLFKINKNEFEFPSDSGTGFIFQIDRNPLFTNVCDLNNYHINQHNVPKKYIHLKGVQFKEAELLFSTKHGNNFITDTHPMRGLLKNNPYETSMNTFLTQNVSLGIISPEKDISKFYGFLSKQNQNITKYNSKDDYVLDFPGFYNIYNLSLNIPEVSSDNWQKLDELQDMDLKQKIINLRRNICDKINTLIKIGQQNVLVIYIPQRWESFTSYYADGEAYDLHDYIKAFCVEKRVTSQIIREKTIDDKTQACQINWWLSLSYYVKSLRTPWILNNIDNSTAFAGIGYSIDSKTKDKGHIVLGCSHIYSSTGEGLKYKLSKINNDRIQWRHKKPHLGYDDAYEFGRNIINLFYESMNKIPTRVVIHKRTFFTKDEKKGILDSLYDCKGIESVDLIEINFEDDIKYVSSKIRNGKAEIDGFSVSRGTCIQLSKSQALLWAHGVVPSVNNPKYNFYQGGRYIPKPLKVKKHHGEGRLEQIASEILGLTKMNWNSLNMYSQLPATISSSNDIARIGKLIENRTKIEYDYRYFI